MKISQKASFCNIKSMNKISAVLIFIAFLCSCSDRKYQVEGSHVAEKITSVLIRSNICVDEKDCASQQIIFGEFGDGVHLSIYGIRDKKVVSDIFSALLTEDSGLQTVSIDISVYKDSKISELNDKHKPKYNMRINK